MSKAKKSGKTSKTSQVLNLLTGETEKPNPLLWAGIPKEVETPPQDGGNPHLYTGEEIADLSEKSPSNSQEESIAEIPLEEVEKPVEEVVSVNLIEYVARGEVGYILERFNTCHCEKCCEKAVELICQKVAPRYINRLSGGSWQNPEYAQKQKKTALDMISRETIKIILGRKRKPFHMI